MLFSAALLTEKLSEKPALRFEIKAQRSGLDFGRKKKGADTQLSASSRKRSGASFF